MEGRSNRTAIIAVAVGVIGLFLGICLGAAAGGAGGYILGRQIASRGPLPAPQIEEEAVPVPREQVVPPTFPEQDLPPSGALLRDVIPETPAEEAGLRTGDIITRVDGVTIDERNPLPNVIRGYEPGDEVELQVWRLGESRTVTVMLGEHPDQANRAYLGVNAVQVSMRPPAQPNG